MVPFPNHIQVVLNQLVSDVPYFTPQESRDDKPALFQKAFPLQEFNDHTMLEVCHNQVCRFLHKIFLAGYRVGREDARRGDDDVGHALPEPRVAPPRNGGHGQAHPL